MTRIFAALLCCSLTFVPIAAMAQSKDLVGGWKLTSNTTTDAAGKKQATFGDKQMGQVVFGADGRYAIVITRGDLPKFAGNNRLKGTTDEKVAVNDGVIAHFGTYKYDEKSRTLTFKIEGSSFPNWVGQEQTREVTLANKELKWTNKAASGGGVAELVWKKQ